MRVSLMQFITDQTPPPQAVAVGAEERKFAGLYVPEKTHGVGFGWNVEELADHGVAFADRVAVTVDKLTAIRALWAADPTSHTGPYTSVPESWAWPKPVSAPPVLFGCRSSMRAFDVIARHGDGWQPIEGYGELLPALSKLSAAFERAGRDPATAQVCVYSSAGDPRTLDAYRAAGVAEVALTLPSAGHDDVLAALDQLAPLVSEFGAEMSSHA